MFKEVDPRQDFIKLEHNIIGFWRENDIEKKYLSKNKESKKKWSFLDGPMTANNPMGVHHAWGRTLKDLWQRYYTMKGYKQRYQNGFDCQGLWVEVEVEKELGFKNKKDIEKYGVDKFVQKCKERVLKYAGEITDRSERLAEWMHWDNSYFTMSDENNYTIWHFLKVCYENGWIYQGTDSVPWCPRCGTAISQHEMLSEEYKEIIHDSIYFKLPIKDGKYKGYYLLVWTTTPWTIPANAAVAVDPSKEYAIVDVNGEKLILIKTRITKVIREKYTVVKEIIGKELVSLHYEAPFSGISGVKKQIGEYDYMVIESDDMILPVTDQEGTGLVHIAPGAGSEDFKLGKVRNVPVINVIDEEAKYLEFMDEFKGLNAKEKPEIIFDYLKKTNNGRYLYKIEPYKHRYPTCWRCKTELVWRNVDEWYIAMDLPPKSKVKGQKTKVEEKTYREQMKEVAKKINWIPKWGKDRELDWLDNMHDWLISKKRYWGLALPIWVCEKCKHFEVIGSKEELKDKAIKGWEKFDGHSPHKPWIDEIVVKCGKCGNNAKRIADVGNPWLDAGIVPFSTYIDPKTKKVSYLDDKKYWQEWFPVDFVTESFPGQFKNWFYALIAMSTALENINPYKNLLGHALVKDEHGEEMHKSKGNAIPFDEAAEKMGVDVMRWMYTSHNPVQNLNFGYTSGSDILRRFMLTFWNTYSFFITYANVDGWKSDNNENDESNILDKWIISRLQESIKTVDENMKIYNSFKATEAIENFVTDLSTWYLRLSRKRRNHAFYKTMHGVLMEVTKLIAPFMPHIAESIYQNIKGNNDIESIHLVEWPEYSDKNVDIEILEKMESVKNIVELAHSIRKEKGIKVRQPLQKLLVKGIKLAEVDLLGIIMAETNVKDIKFVDIVKNEKYVGIKEGYGIVVGLDLEISDELRNEGMQREIVRQIQFLRKKAGYKANDEIILYVSTESEEMINLIDKNIDAIKKMTISKSIEYSDLDDPKAEITAKINNETVTLKVK